jgi:hypothetical protein
MKSDKKKKKRKEAWCRWLTSVILATQKIRRIMVQSQPQANSSYEPISKKPNTRGLVEWLKW